MRTQLIAGGLRPNTRNAVIGIISLLGALTVVLALVTGVGGSANAAKVRANASAELSSSELNRVEESRATADSNKAAAANKAGPCSGHNWKRYSPPKKFVWQKTSGWLWSSRNSKPGDTYVQFRSLGGEYVYKEMKDCSIVRGRLAGATSYHYKHCGDMRACETTGWRTITTRGNCVKVYNKIMAYDPEYRKCFTYAS